MVAFKIVTLALATLASASTFYAAPPGSSSALAVSPSANEPAVTTVTSTTTVVMTGVPVSTITLPVIVHSSSTGDYINLSSELSRAGNNLTMATTSTVASVPLSTNVPTINSTIAANITFHSATVSVSVTSALPTQTSNSGDRAKVGVAMGIFALVLGALGA